MTLEEYCDASRFPATTQQGLTPKQQLFIDAHNHDDLKEFFDGGGKPSERQKKIWAELERKMPYAGRLAKEAEKAGAGAKKAPAGRGQSSPQ